MTPLRILIVEDDPDAARIVAATLAPHGCDCVTRHALGDVTDADLDGADCVVVDLSLPDSSARHTMAWAAAQRAARPVVVLSGVVDTPEAAVLGRSRIPVLTKPPRPEELVGVVLREAADATLWRALVRMRSALVALESGGL